MKSFKKILIILLILIVIAGGLMIILPQKYHVERKVSIDAPVELVKEQTIMFSNFTQWNPWNTMDPDMKIIYSGTEGAIGSKYEWTGNDDVGKGSQEITEISDSRVDISLNFIEPWEDQANTYFTFAETNEGTEVVWGMDGKMKPPFNLMTLFMSMENMIGDDYEKGLATLKTRCEKMAADKAWKGFKVEKINYPPTTLASKKTTVPMAEMQQFFDNGFQELMSKVTLSEQEHPFGIYYNWDEANQMTTMAVAVPYHDELEGYEKVEIGGEALKIMYTGDYEGSAEAHYAMDEYIKTNDLQSGLVVEEYVTGPMTEPDSSKWITNIYYFL